MFNQNHLEVIAEAATEWALARQEFLAKAVTVSGDLDRLSRAERRLYDLTEVK